jgi:hypothetical protein
MELDPAMSRMLGRTYDSDEARARKIADRMAKKHGWKVEQMIREW